MHVVSSAYFANCNNNGNANYNNASNSNGVRPDSSMFNWGRKHCPFLLQRIKDKAKCDLLR